MTDLLNSAISGLLAAQRQLATTSHDIANVDVEGYSRQRVELNTQTPQTTNRIASGRGVVVTDIDRFYDSFTTSQIREVSSEQSRLDSVYQLASIIDDTLADAQGGITPVLQNFFSATQDLAGDPNSAPARIALIDQAGALAARFGYVDDRLNSLQQDLTDRTRDAVDDINRITAELFETNNDIRTAEGTTSRPPPDLLDRRDTLLQQLSEHIPIQAIELPTGAVDVFVGQGQSLITGNAQSQLTATLNSADPSTIDIRIQNAGTAVDITRSITGGELGGILEFRNTLIDDVRNGLGRLSIGIGELFNQQHREGVDQAGNFGGDFFTVGSPAIITNSGNTGLATVTAVISDVSTLTTDNYDLGFDGANWTLANRDGSSSIVGAGPTLTLEGVTVTLAGGAPAAGDSFLIKPTIAGAGAFEVAITRSENIATASPIRTGDALSNNGNGLITSGTVLNIADPNLRDPVTISFNTPSSTFDLIDSNTGVVLAAAQAFTPGANIDFNGWRVQIAGTPSPNDTFTIDANTNGVSDNANALALADLQNFGAFDSGGTDFQEAFSEVVADVGSKTRFADSNRSAQEALKQSLVDRRESIAGVNLDEEAADLIRFQQAYQAAARTISSAQEIFQSLIASF